MTHNVLNSYHARNAAYRSFLRNRNEQSFMKYKQLRNKATRQTRLAKRLFFYAWCTTWYALLLEEYKRLH